MAEVFRRYAERLEGSASIANWLTERGYRTKRGKPFNVPGVLTILHNRAYLGEVYFRRRRYPAPHEPLVDRELFERAVELLRERGEDASLRRSNRSDYLLTGLVKCARCGKRYVGAAAHGNGGRYAYYVCFSRQRYGKKACDAERLPAAELEDAILIQLERVLAQDVEEIRVVSRAEIYPAFSLPTARPPSGSARPASHNPNHAARLAPGRVVLGRRHAKSRKSEVSGADRGRRPRDGESPAR